MLSSRLDTIHPTMYIISSGLAPAILDWYGHCVCVSVNKLGGSGGMLPQEKIRHSEIASEAMFGPKKLLEFPHL